MKMSEFRALVLAIPASADDYKVVFDVPSSSTASQPYISEIVEVDNGDVNVSAAAAAEVIRPQIVIFKAQPA